MAETIFHKDLTSEELHVPGYLQATDPGSIGAGKYWIDTSLGSGKWSIKARNSSNTGWEFLFQETPETEPLFTASEAYKFVTGDKANLDGWVNSEAFKFVAGDKANLDNQSGVNTGNQDLSGLIPYTLATKDADLGDYSLRGKELIPINSGTINRTLEVITSIAITGGRTKTYTRNASGYVISMNDGIKTWTYTRDANNRITNWSVA